MADYCTNKYDHDPMGTSPFSGETRTITNPDPDAIHGVPINYAPESKTKFSRGQATEHSSGTPLYP